MRHLDEGTIHAWLDGALSGDEAARTEAHVASCTTCADAVAEARGLIAASSRILLALDDVPNVRGARGAGGAAWGRRSLATWLVRERIAAVVALVVAGGALAVALSRDPQSASIQPASEPVQMVELAAADSPARSRVAEGDGQKESQLRGVATGRGAGASPSGARDFAARQAEVARPSVPQTAAQVVTTEAANAPAPPTDDTVRPVAIAKLEREETQQLSAEAKSSIGEKVAGVVLSGRRAGADASARFAEPRALEPSIRGAVGAAEAVGEPRLVHEERMREGGREVRRRIYRVEGTLVTLDERFPDTADEVARAPSANVAPAPSAQAAPAAPDTTAGVTNAIRWTDARGAKLTLTGAVSQARLEQIRKLLGY